MSRTRNVWLRLLALTLTLGWSWGTQAQSLGPEAFLKQRQRKVQRLVAKTPKGSPLGDALSHAIGDLLDYDELSRRALADHWDKRSPQERSEFVSLLKQLVERSYRQNLRSTLGYRIDYLGSDQTEAGALVRTVASSKKNRRAPKVSIDYTLVPRGDGWRVVNITTDGVSMVRNYRRQFNRILRKHGWDELIRRMRARLEKRDLDV